MALPPRRMRGAIESIIEEFQLLQLTYADPHDLEAGVIASHSRAVAHTFLE